MSNYLLMLFFDLLPERFIHLSLNESRSNLQYHKDIKGLMLENYSTD